MISESDLGQYKSRDKIPLECLYCKNIFYKTKNKILVVLKGTGEVTRDFCSRKCMGLYKNKKISYKCRQCFSTILRSPSEIKGNKNIFCNHTCRAKYNNSHKTWGSNRSKLEMWLEIQLTKQYPNLLIEYNKTNAINAELDIYIPSLKLAFELNGIFHYEPIFGKEKLLSYQNNDSRKYQACLENNIELCIIDTHNIKYLKKERDKKFLDIIINIIRNKLVRPSSTALDFDG
jgi:hypothetical protein